MVARDGIEPPTPAFSGPRSTTELSGLPEGRRSTRPEGGETRRVQGSPAYVDGRRCWPKVELRWVYPNRSASIATHCRPAKFLSADLGTQWTLRYDAGVFATGCMEERCSNAAWSAASSVAWNRLQGREGYAEGILPSGGSHGSFLCCRLPPACSCRLAIVRAEHRIDASKAGPAHRCALPGGASRGEGLQRCKAARQAGTVCLSETHA